MAILFIAEVIAADFLIACLFRAALGLGLGRTGRTVALFILGLLAALAPLLVPARYPLHRFLAICGGSVVVLVKLYDLYVDANKGRAKPTWRSVLIFVPNAFFLVLRKRDSLPRPSRRENLRQLGLNLVGLAAGVVIEVWLFQVDWYRYPFLLENSAKVIALYLALIPAMAVLVAIWRLLGAPALDFMDNPFASRTPADFWRRYNRPVQQFFYEDVFKPVGGFRAPVRATLLVFVVSAAIHEYVFDMAAGRIQGYQTLFFLTQGVAVAATIRIKPRGWVAVPWIIGTWAFNLATSILFFASMNELVPFWSSGGPRWP